MLGLACLKYGVVVAKMAGHECIFTGFFCNIFANIDNIITAGYFHVFTCVNFTTYNLCIEPPLKVFLCKPFLNLFSNAVNSKASNVVKTWNIFSKRVRINYGVIIKREWVHRKKILNGTSCLTARWNECNVALTPISIFLN